MKRLLLFAGGALVLAALVAIAMLWWSSGPKPGPHTIIVKEGSTLTSVARQLDEMGAIPGNELTFRAMARVFASSDPVQAGEFEIPEGTSAAAILDLLQHGQPVQRLITIPEGMPSILVQEKLAAVPYLTSPAPLPEEGSVLPDTYHFQRGESRADVVGRMQKAMTMILDALWAKRKPTCPIASKSAAVTLASIVEKETAKRSERRTIAGVYCNRLRIGMKLDADPTVIYPVTKGKPLGRRIRRSELLSDHPYNTYANPGLPPGPIANPGRESIAAVLDPAPTDAIYFVADGTGGHIFADTFEEHRENVRRWYAIRRARGEM
ncbi:MAG: endolytic transglycosylase MltG [Sphingomicrobium sp.]